MMALEFIQNFTSVWFSDQILIRKVEKRGLICFFCTFQTWYFCDQIICQTSRWRTISLKVLFHKNSTAISKMIPRNCAVANADMTGCLKSYLTKTKPRSLISWGTTQSLALSFMSSSIGFSTMRYQDIYLAHRIQQPVMKLIIRLNVNDLYKLEQSSKNSFVYIFSFSFLYQKQSVWY